MPQKQPGGQSAAALEREKRESDALIAAVSAHAAHAAQAEAARHPLDVAADLEVRALANAWAGLEIEPDVFVLQIRKALRARYEQICAYRAGSGTLTAVLHNPVRAPPHFASDFVDALHRAFGGRFPLARAAKLGAAEVAANELALKRRLMVELSKDVGCLLRAGAAPPRRSEKWQT